MKIKLTLLILFFCSSLFSETFILTPDDKTNLGGIIHRNGKYFETEDGLYKFKITYEDQNGITLISSSELGPGFDFYIIHKNVMRYTYGTFSSHAGYYKINVGDIEIRGN